MTTRTLLLTALAMLAFAGNSLLCRLALRDTGIDAASFTAVRLLAGALSLWLLLRLGAKRGRLGGSWSGAVALFVYAAGFSFAYLQLDTGVGALLLFGAVQLGMLLYGLSRGERLGPWASLGLLLALAGLVALLLPGANAPAPGSAALMLLAGLAWAVYSLLGRGSADPLAATAGNFLRAVPLALALGLLLLAQREPDPQGLAYALLSGALTSGLGYAVWYSALRGLGALQAATVQLSVPILAALAGALLLGEALTLRLGLASLAVLGGIALVLTAERVAPAVRREA
ncbi:EamA family transporter [Azotobacter chroococcum]|uniref:Threonine/homoserine efflux transporter RhtA n=1 Tax=Azotobacter chroococcum TaxID=353 RepID=A0A4R1P6H8_9GAMM|nr:EamA family transporter [Azotobacter chroococcum]TBV95663.1 EamA family transporter [Azotobacter chroococcum]TCL22422.1 threonine/homoserine efflux transporter RhtA [Azotobacter chroococcum]